MTGIELTDSVLKQLETLAIEGYPEEICGFLYGRQDGTVRVIESVLQVTNDRAENRNKRFEISPQDYLAGERHALDVKKDLLGIYHTHPDHPALPSRHDYAQAVPYFSYLIISVKGSQLGKITSWQLNDERKFIRENIFTPINQLKQ
jgi:proteasome lid subunit RPN8/RPN11